MPVRSLRSFVLRWPDRAAVDRAVRDWASAVGDADPHVVRIGYFGSYARGNWGVGSDLDLVLLLDESSERSERRALAFDTGVLPVPTDVFVYTLEEWRRMANAGGFAKTVGDDVVWVYSRRDRGSG